MSLRFRRALGRTGRSAALTLLLAGCRENLVPPPSSRPAAPVLTYITPSLVPEGTSSLTLRVVGEHFTDSSVVRWNGADLPTTFVSVTELHAALSAADLAAPALAHITVFTPPPGGGESQVARFTVQAVAAIDSVGLPLITRLLPSGVPQHGGAVRLTIYGTSFAPRSVIRWNGAELATTWYKDTRIVATVPAAFRSAGGSASVTVHTPAPGGGTSAPHPFGIIAAAPGHPQAWEVTPLPIADAPRYVAVGAHDTGYVARPGSDSILRVDLGTGANLGSFPAGRRPGDIAVGGGTAWIASAGDSSIVVVQLASGAPVATWPLAAPPLRAIVDVAAARLYATTGGGTLLVLDAVTGARTASLALPGRGVALARTGSRLFVACDDGTLAEVATATAAIVRTVTLGGTPRDLALSPDGTTLFVALDETVDVYALATFAAPASLPVVGAFGLAVTPDGTQLWVTQPAGGRVTVIDVTLGRALGIVYTFGVPRYVRFSTAGDAALIADEGGGVLVIR